MTKLGAGVYPIGALLNHSCDANCVVSYNPSTHAQIIRCMQDVAAGEELTHMYLDAAATRPPGCTTTAFFPSPGPACRRS